MSLSENNESNSDRQLDDRLESYLELIMNGPAAQYLNLDPTSLRSDMYNIIRSEKNPFPTLIQFLNQYITPAKEASDFKMTFQETSELVSILPPRAPKELSVVLKRDKDGRLKVVYDGEIDVATTAGRKE